MKAPVWVLDTNVLVSALLNPAGHPGRLLDSVLSDFLVLAIDDRIFAEYAAVLKRPKFKFDRSDARDLLAFFRQQQWINARPLKLPGLPDSSDQPFAEVALSLDEPVLVTGNPRHFPKSKLPGPTILSPQQAWELLAKPLK